jgi:1-phosphatidylinositol phosphodiesterase
MLASVAAAVAVATGAGWWAMATAGTAQAADPSYQTLTSANNPDWMKSVADGTSLAAMSIPGTHETLSIHGGDAVKTQEDHGDSAGTLAAQLTAGIRMIDIRVRVNDGNTFTVHHGMVYQVANFDDVLNTLGSFLDQHPSEAVVMRVKHECTGEAFSCKDAGGQNSFEDIFDSYRDNNAAAKAHLWAPSVNRGQAAPTPTLGDVRGKIVLAVLNEKFGGPVGAYGLAQFGDWHNGSSTYIQDDYDVPNPGAIATKRDRVRRHLDRTNAGEADKMYVNFTSGASAFAYPYNVAGGIVGQTGVNPFLLGYLGEGAVTTRTGMIMMDFPGGGLIDAIIAFNKK